VLGLGLTGASAPKVASVTELAYTMDDVAKHATKTDCWLVVDGGAPHALCKATAMCVQSTLREEQRRRNHRTAVTVGADVAMQACTT
jgi:hypothetical protein